MSRKTIQVIVPIVVAILLVFGILAALPVLAMGKTGWSPADIKQGQIQQAPSTEPQTSYGEAPMLAAMVSAGLLPPVEERLPIAADITVVDPVDGVGEYGGIWHNTTWWQGYGNIAMILYDPPIRWKSDYSGYEAGLLKSWDISLDGHVITWTLRQGVKWSDGVPFTTADLQFWWEDLATNEDFDLVTIPWWGYNPDGSPMIVTFPDPYTMVMTWNVPRHTSPYIVGQGYWEWLPMERPKHFLSQFHPDYNPSATYEDLEAYVHSPTDWIANVEGYPCLHAWCPETVVPDEYTVWLRNPYYWKIDTAGNQLPYIDRLDVEMIPDPEERLQEIVEGSYEATFRGADNPTDIPYLVANQVSGDYQVWPGAVNGAGGWPCWLVNQNFNDQVDYPDDWDAIGDLLRDKNFRQGLSHAMDREAVIDVVWGGNGTPTQGTISPQSWHFLGPEGQAVYQAWASSYITYNTVEASALFTAANFIDQDNDGWRDLPDSQPFTLTLDMGDWGGVQVSTAATYELKDQLEAMEIRVKINDLLNNNQTWDFRQTQGLYMLRNCHAAELDLWTYPDWVFPVRDNRAWPLEGLWRQTGGAEGWEPQPGSPAYELQALYDLGLAEPDENLRHEIVWDAINIHIQEGPFMIGASGDQPMPVVVHNGFHGVPLTPIILGPWAPGSPGNLFPEQFWMEEALREEFKIFMPGVLRDYTAPVESTWSIFPSPITNTLRSVDMLSPTEGWAVGDNGKIIEWNGSAWSEIASPTTNDLNAVSMVSSTDGWAVGDGGVLIHWDGDNWSAESTPVPGIQLNEVSMLGTSDGWAVGNGGVILDWSGTSWSSVTSPTSYDLFGLGFITADNGWAVGGSWNTGIGWYEDAKVKWNGSNWTLYTAFRLLDILYAVDFTSSTYGWSVGINNAKARWNGTSWIQSYGYQPMTYHYDVDMLAENNGWAVGWDYTRSNIRNWDGSEWVEVSCPVSDGLYGISMVSEDEGWAVGANGVILLYGPPVP